MRSHANFGVRRNISQADQPGNSCLLTLHVHMVSARIAFYLQETSLYERSVPQRHEPRHAARVVARRPARPSLPLGTSQGARLEAGKSRDPRRRSQGTKVQDCDQRGQNLQHWRSRGRWPLQKEAGRRDPAAAWAAVVGGHLSMPGQQYLAEARRPWLAATARRHAPRPHSRGRGRRPPGDAGRPAGGHGGMPAPRPLL